MHTAFGARLNLDIRQRAAVGRWGNTGWQGEEGVHHPLVLCKSDPNCVLPQASLRQPLRMPEATNGSGSVQVWRPCTPAMAAGLTEHGWSLKELPVYRVPPWSQAQTV
jgi:hypothetical protein